MVTKKKPKKKFNSSENCMQLGKKTAGEEIHELSQFHRTKNHWNYLKSSDS